MATLTANGDPYFWDHILTTTSQGLGDNTNVRDVWGSGNGTYTTSTATYSYSIRYFISGYTHERYLEHAEDILCRRLGLYIEKDTYKLSTNMEFRENYNSYLKNIQKIVGSRLIDIIVFVQNEINLFNDGSSLTTGTFTYTQYPQPQATERDDSILLAYYSELCEWVMDNAEKIPDLYEAIHSETEIYLVFKSLTAPPEDHK
jgi:hypothetical protein